MIDRSSPGTEEEREPMAMAAPTTPPHRQEIGTTLFWFLAAVALFLLAVTQGCDCGAGITGQTPPMCTSSDDCGGDPCLDGHCVGSSCASGNCPDRASACPITCGCDNPECMPDGIGIGTGRGFDLDGDPNDGVGLNPDGFLVLDSAMVDTDVIWIANTQEGTVSKVDTRTYVELARYRTGPTGGGEFFSGEDPSRTSVNTFSDVYVGNRAGGSVTKISVLGADCPDTNGDGMITTSTGAADILPWGMDDCVLWRTELPTGGYIRAVAAQDVEGIDFTLHPYVWIGGWDGKVWKLDGNTGDVVIDTAAPVAPYGFAIDGAGNLWISSRDSGSLPFGLGVIDTNRCTDNASCDVAVCDDAGGADCIKQRFTAPANLYGITVDAAQRVWMGGDATYRFDPAGGGWSTIPTGASFGVAADARGFVYAATMAGPIYQIVADDPSSYVAIAGTAGYSARGVAVDADGKIWGINMDHNNATVMTPTDALGEVEVVPGIAAGLVRPYTYSDMTGQQLRLATRPRGYYRRTFDGCPDDGTNGGTNWLLLHWTADVGPGTRLLWRIRTADSPEALEAAEWIVAAMVPDDVPPVDLAMLLSDAGVEHGAFMEVEVQLIADEESRTEVITPVVKGFEIAHRCRANIG